MATKSVVLFGIAVLPLFLLLTASDADPLSVSATASDKLSLSIEESALGPFFANPIGPEGLRCYAIGVSTSRRATVSISLIDGDASSPASETSAGQLGAMFRTTGFWSPIEADGVEITGTDPGRASPIYLLLDAEQMTKGGKSGAVAIVSVVED